MRRRLVVALSAALASISSTALAEGNDAAAASTEAHCRWVQAVSDSQNALYWSPQLFVSGGLVTGADASTGNSATPAQPRVIAGMQLSAANIYRAVQTKALADAECERYRVFNKLLAYTFSHSGGRSAPALAAKLDVLDTAMPRAEEILKSARANVAASTITIDELDATQVRVDALHALASETRGQLRAAGGAMKAPAERLEDMVAERDKLERAAELRAAKLRQSQAWDVQLRGGYDQIYGLRQPVPAFGMITFTFSPGYFWQPAADERAIQARADAARTGLEDATLRAQDLARELGEQAKAERERLDDVVKLRGELEERHSALAKLEGDRPKAAADILWLWLVTLRAEDAYLRAHIADLTKIAAR